MRCPECKYHCPAKTVSCDRCGAAMVQPRRASSPLGTRAALACVAVVLVKLVLPAGAARDAARQPSPPQATARAQAPAPTSTPRPTGPTLNGVPYDRSPLVQRVDLNQPAPQPPRR